MESITILVVLLSFIPVTAGELCVDDVNYLRARRMEIKANMTYWNELFLSSVKNDGIDSDTMYALANAASDAASSTAEKGYVMLDVISEMTSMKSLCLNDIQTDADRIELFRAVVGDLCLPQVTCSEEVTSSPYRTFDGSCNNLDNPQWGMTGRAQRRILQPAFENDIGSPRQNGVDGEPLPSARIVSNAVHRSLVENERDIEATVAVMAFGQFFDHDLIKTPVTTASGKTAINCCKNETKMNPFFGSQKTCYPIDIPVDDKHFHQHGQTCMNVVRSAPAVCDGCKPCKRQQINDVSAYIDASNVYGSSTEFNTDLRTMTKGMMKVNNSKSGNLPPKRADSSTCTLTHSGEYCLKAGDVRVNVVPVLSAMHTIFLREHNKIAGELAETNRHWDDERLFQEGRKIVIAQMQHIVYNEYLPVVLGNDIMLKYGLLVSKDYNDVYDDTTDATTSSSFGVASFRFGHAAIPNFQKMFDEQFKPEQVFPIQSTYNNPHMTFVNTNGVARWAVSDIASRTNRFFDKGVRDELFKDKNNRSLDLPSVNIQRGRDHGIQGYTFWRRYCHLPNITVDQFKKDGEAMGDTEAISADRLRKVYRHPDDIDLFSGAMTETKVAGAQVGPTFACLLGEEFKRLKFGDRFFYENPPKAEAPFIGFTEDQLKTIKQTTLARIICRNADVPHIQMSVFRPSCKGCNTLMDCDNLAKIDVSQWREQP